MRCLTQHLEGARQIAGVNYYTILGEGLQTLNRRVGKSYCLEKKNFMKRETKLVCMVFSGMDGGKNLTNSAKCISKMDPDDPHLLVFMPLCNPISLSD